MDLDELERDEADADPTEDLYWGEGPDDDVEMEQESDGRNDNGIEGNESTGLTANGKKIKKNTF